MRRRAAGNAHVEQTSATSAPARRRTAASTKQRQKSHYHQQQQQPQAGTACFAAQSYDFESTQITRDDEPRTVDRAGDVNREGDQEVSLREMTILPLTRPPHKNGPLEEKERVSNFVRQRQRRQRQPLGKSREEEDAAVVAKTRHDVLQQAPSLLDSVKRDESRQATKTGCDSPTEMTKTSPATMSPQSIVTHIPSILMCESIVLTQPNMPAVKIYMSRPMDNDTPCLTFATAAPPPTSSSSSSSAPNQPSQWTVFDVRPVPTTAMIEAWASGQQ